MEKILQPHRASARWPYEHAASVGEIDNALFFDHVLAPMTGFPQTLRVARRSLDRWSAMGPGGCQTGGGASKERYPATRSESKS
jgi:hypothetical protein